jgi:hypothetical protein
VSKDVARRRGWAQADERRREESNFFMVNRRYAYEMEQAIANCIVRMIIVNKMNKKRCWRIRLKRLGERCSGMKVEPFD